MPTKKDGIDSFGHELNRSGVACAGSHLNGYLAFQSRFLEDRMIPENLNARFDTAVLRVGGSGRVVLPLFVISAAVPGRTRFSEASP